MTTILSATIAQQIRALCASIALLSEDEAIAALNEAKRALHAISPFATEPVDCVVWVPAEQIEANDYNPNVVAPPEMRLLETSILSDGYTQPIVTYPIENTYEVVDGFHRNRVGKEKKAVRLRLHGYLPITEIRPSQNAREDRIAATIRHNRARGKHQVAAMSEIVQELTRRNWTEERIGRELGMEPDEVLRLKQISGLSEMFADREFSAAWEIELEETPITE